MIDPLRIHRIAHALCKRRVKGIPGILYRINYLLTGCDLPPQVAVGKRVIFRHFGSGVVVHANTVIGNDVWINSQVVIGVEIRPNIAPLYDPIVIEDGVMIGAGAKIIASGPLTIGKGAAIGANAVVLSSVPAGTTAVGIPARIIDRRNGLPWDSAEPAERARDRPRGSSPSP